MIKNCRNKTGRNRGFNEIGLNKSFKAFYCFTVGKSGCFFYLAKINGFKPVATTCTEATPLWLQFS